MGAWDRSGVRRAVAPSARPVLVEDEELEWQTASWARNEDQKQTKEGTGKGSRATGRPGRKAKMSEGDRILDKIKKGDVKLDAPEWEGGGRVDRDNRSNAAKGKGKGKGGW